MSRFKYQQFLTPPNPGKCRSFQAERNGRVLRLPRRPPRPEDSRPSSTCRSTRSRPPRPSRISGTRRSQVYTVRSPPKSFSSQFNERIILGPKRGALWPPWPLPRPILLFLKMGHPFLLIFSLLRTEITIFTTNRCEKYMVLGFQPTTFRTWVSTVSDPFMVF